MVNDPTIVDTLQTWFQIAAGDCDKADTVENEAYYAGQMGAYEDALRLILGIAPGEEIDS